MPCYLAVEVIGESGVFECAARGRGQWTAPQLQAWAEQIGVELVLFDRLERPKIAPPAPAVKVKNHHAHSGPIGPVHRRVTRLAWDPQRQWHRLESAAGPAYCPVLGCAWRAHP
jgi:hypothetical protein